jgi:hypothetical protein
MEDISWYRYMCSGFEDRLGWALVWVLGLGCWHACGFTIPLMRVIIWLDGWDHGVMDIEENYLTALLNTCADSCLFIILDCLDQYLGGLVPYRK